MRRLFLVCEHRFPEHEKLLREQIKSLEDENQRLRRDFSSLEHKFGYEVLLNGELVDILKAHDIDFRQHLDYRKHPF